MGEKRECGAVRVRGGRWRGRGDGLGLVGLRTRGVRMGLWGWVLVLVLGWEGGSGGAGVSAVIQDRCPGVVFTARDVVAGNVNDIEVVLCEGCECGSCEDACRGLPVGRDCECGGDKADGEEVVCVDILVGVSFIHVAFYGMVIGFFVGPGAGEVRVGADVWIGVSVACDVPACGRARWVDRGERGE